MCCERDDTARKEGAECRERMITNKLSRPAATRNFHLGATAKGLNLGPGLRGSPEARAVCRHFVQILTVETVKTGKIFAKLATHILDQSFSQWLNDTL